MTIQIDDFKTYAQQLFDEYSKNKKSNNDSIILRTIINRSYYYVFHYTRNRFYEDGRAKFKKLPMELQQKEAIDFFRRIRATHITNYMQDFKMLRNISDYDLDEEITFEHARKCVVNHMSNIIQRANSITPQISN